ncbi:hypothetical protein [Nonomuraea dietziae]
MNVVLALVAAFVAGQGQVGAGRPCCAASASSAADVTLLAPTRSQEA